MAGNLVAKAATWYRAEPGDLYAATRVLDGRPTPESADERSAQTISPTTSWNRFMARNPPAMTTATMTGVRPSGCPCRSA